MENGHSIPLYQRLSLIHIFSESEKLSHKQLLFDRGLALIMERGYKNVTVDELIKLTGLSLIHI